MKNGFFEDQNGDKSSSRLIAVIMIGFGLIMCSSFILIGVVIRPAVDLMKIALAIGVLFSSVAGPALLFLFAQKKEEGKQEEVKQNLTAKIENPDNKNLITPTT